MQTVLSIAFFKCLHQQNWKAFKTVISGDWVYVMNEYEKVSALSYNRKWVPVGAVFLGVNRMLKGIWRTQEKSFKIKDQESNIGEDRLSHAWDSKLMCIKGSKLCDAVMSHDRTLVA